MPVTLAVPYRTYAALRSSGSLDLRGTACPRADCRESSGGAPLVLSSTTVLRWIVLQEIDADSELVCIRLQVKIALGYCQRCKARARLLPCDVLPYKQYSLAVIEPTLLSYRQGDMSLRAVVWQLLGARTPAHTSLHGWSEGLGAYSLGYTTGAQLGATPASALFAATEPRVPLVKEERRSPPPIPPVRYRSVERKERLEAAFVFVACALIVAASIELPGAMAEWNRLLIGWIRPAACPIAFRSGCLCTSSEHVSGTSLQSSALDKSEETMRWPARSRSPPGASSR